MTEKWLDPLSLELLVAVADNGSLSAAARSLGIAQPNASRMISSLEKLSGLPLLVRHTTGSQLSENAQALLPMLRKALKELSAVTVAAKQLAGDSAQKIAVGASMTVAEYFMPSWLAQLRTRSPLLRFELEVGNSARMFKLVDDGLLDVAFVETPAIPPTLKQIPVASDNLVLIVAAEHPWAKAGKKIPAATLARHPLIVREPGSGTRVAFELAMAEALRQADVLESSEQWELPIDLELSSNQAVILAVSSGNGAAVLSERAVSSHISRGELAAVELSDVQLVRQITAVWRGPRVLRGPAGELVQTARKTAR